MASIMDFRYSVVIIGCFSLIYTGCSPPTQTLKIYNNSQAKLVREYKVTSSSLGTDSITVKLIKYYRNGMKQYQQEIMNNQPYGKYYSWHQNGVKFAKGKYLNEISNSSSIDMCIGVGCYPENHFFSNNFELSND